MNAFADWLFSILLGWTGVLANKVWNAVVNAAGGISDFFARYWLPLVLILILAGTALDFAVWLARWQPYLVWRSWLERRRRYRHEHRAARSLEHSQMDDGTLGTIADWVASPQDQSPVYALDATRQAWQQHDPYMTQEQYDPYTLREQHDPYMPREQQIAQPPYDTASADAHSPYFTAVLPDTHDDRAEPAFAGAAQPMESLPYEDHDELNAAWQFDSSYGNPYAAQAEDAQMPAVSQRRRRSQREKQKPQPLHFFRDLRQRVTAPDDEEGMLDGLPSPVNRQDAFHEAVYPQSYRYRDPDTRPDGQQQETDGRSNGFQ